jgi:hypothetical protein
MHSVRTVMKSRVYGVAGIVVSMVIATAAIAANTQGSDAATVSASTTTSTTPTATTPTATDEPASTAALEAIDTDADFSVSVLDTGTGESLSYGTGFFDTASIVKVDILAALLYQAQQDGRELTATEKSLATAMIERSDNTAATTLFNEVGGKSGLEAFNKVIGLTDTEVGANGYWGLTQTTAADQIRLLKVVFGDDSVLSADSQAYEQGLMSHVIDSQNFGVSAAADDADDAALKVGYLQRSATGLWDVTSIGEIEANGHTYLVAVLSDGNATFDGGVALVNEVAQAAVASLS